MRLSLAVSLFVALSVVGCNDSGEVPGSRISQIQQDQGCHVVCPRCQPNDILCIMAPCHLECPPRSMPCGDGVCHNGETCCNAACGMCSQGGVCEEQPCDPVAGDSRGGGNGGKQCTVIAMCIEGYTWSETKCDCVPDTKECLIMAKCVEGYTWSEAKCDCVPLGGHSSCSTDADCRLFSDYCTGCDCRALGTHERDPVCNGPGVRCFADPCMSSTAACVNGSCVVF